MAGIVKLSEVKFDEPSGIVPLSAIKFDDDESAWEGFVKPTLKAIPRVVGHTVASMAQMPVSGIAAGAKFISSKGDINAASKVMEDNQQALDSFYLTNDAERQGAANIGLAMKPFQMAGEGLQEIVKLTPLEGTIAEPIAGTVGEASAMFGLGGAGKAIKARANKSMGALKDVIEPIKTDIVIKPQKIVRLEDVKFDEPKVEPKIVPLESVKIDEVAPEVKAGVKPVETAIDSGEPNFKTGVPVTFDYIHNTQKAPKMGSRFGQDKEPSGMYIQTKPRTFTPQENLETGTVTFNNPLVVDFGGGYGEATNWKNVLSKQYNGKTGKVLSNAIQKDGYDGIVTISKYGSSEIVKLPKADLPSAETVTPPVKPTVAREAKPIAEQSITAEDFELHPDRMANLKKGFVAFQVDGKTISAKIGSKVNGQEVFNHADLGMAKGIDFDTAVPGFLDKKGRFVEQYPTVKVVTPKADLPSAETVTPPVKPTVAEVKPEPVKTEPIKIEQKLNDEVPVKVAEVTEKPISETKTQENARLKKLGNTEPDFIITKDITELSKDKNFREEKNATALLRKFIATTPEFKKTPIFTVVDTPDGLKLQFNDKYKFRFNTEIFNIDKTQLREGNTVKVDLDEWFKKSTTEDYFIHQKDGSFKKVKGTKVAIPGFEDLDIFYTGNPKGRKAIAFSEGRTGVGLGESYQGDIKSAIEDIQERLLTKFPDSASLKSVIADLESKDGLSPKYMDKAARIEYERQQKLAEFKEDVTEHKGVQLNSGLDPTIAIDIMKTISAKTSEIIEANKMTPSVARGVKAAKDAMIEQDRNVRRAESTSKLFEKTVQDIVPKPERQMEMVHAYEHKMKGKAWDGLTEIEKGVVRWAAEEKAKLNKYIKDNDILETMPESDTINHIFHHWIDKETGKPYKAMYGKFSKGLPQAKQRVIPTYEAGIKNGMTPATTNIGKLIGMEWEAATRANNARQLFKKLHGIKGDENMSIVLSKGGKPQPIRMVESWSKLEKQGLTDGYVRYDNNFLDKAMTFQSSDGRLVTMKGAVGVKEELYPFVHAYIDSPQYGKLSELNFASKSLTLGASLFHPVSLGMQELANLRTPFVHIPKGIRIIKELGPEVRLLHQEGLELFKGYEDLGFKNQFFDDGATLGKVGNAVTWPITKMRDFIFDYVQPGMKVSFAHAMFTKLLPQYLKNTKYTAEEVMAMYESGKPLPPEALQCAREVVQKADGHFSGEHYKRSLLETNRFMVKLYFTPEARVKWQAALLSPTWQREHLLVAKNVVKSFMPDKMIKKLGMAELGPIKSQYRLYALGAAMIIGAVDLWNYNASLIMDGEGKHLWQNPTGKGFAVRAWWNEPAYTIQDKNGRYKYIPEAPAYIRPLKSVFEVAEWAHDPVLKLGYKLSPVLSALGEQLFGQKKYVGLPDIPERAWDFVIDSTTPIVVDQAIRTAQGKQSIQATALPFIGMPVSRLKQMNYKSNPEGN